MEQAIKTKRTWRELQPSWTQAEFDSLLEPAIEAACSMPRSKRRALIAPWLAGDDEDLPWNQTENRDRGAALVGIQQCDWELEDYVVVVAAAIVETGWWSVQVHYTIDVQGCQYCIWAEGTSDKITGCAWEPPDPKAIEGKLARKMTHSWPDKWLAMVREQGRILPDGSIDTEDMIIQCSKFEGDE